MYVQTLILKLIIDFCFGRGDFYKNVFIFVAIILKNQFSFGSFFAFVFRILNSLTEKCCMFQLSNGIEWKN